MLYKAKVAVCADFRTKRSTQSEHHAELLNVKPWWYVKKPLGFKRLTLGLVAVCTVYCSVRNTLHCVEKDRLARPSEQTAVP